MESTLKFFGEMYDEYLHKAEEIIEEWDYQDFSPDKRCALLEGEVTADIQDDLYPENDAIHEIKGVKNFNWSGEAPDADLEDYDLGTNISNTNNLDYEAKIVMMCTPSAGVHGLPDPDVQDRFLKKAMSMNPEKVANAFASRLMQQNWQVRSKSLALMTAIMEHKELEPRYVSAFSNHSVLMNQVDTIRCQDHGNVTREIARKLLSLIRSNGQNAQLIAPIHMASKPHVRHQMISMNKDQQRPKTTNQRRGQHGLTIITKAPAVNNIIKTPQALVKLSPRVAQAALASWRRRAMMMSDAPNLMPFQSPDMKMNEGPNAFSKNMTNNNKCKGTFSSSVPAVPMKMSTGHNVNSFTFSGAASTSSSQPLVFL